MAGILHPQSTYLLEVMCYN